MRKAALTIALSISLLISAFSESLLAAGIESATGLGAGKSGLEAFDGDDSTYIDFPSGSRTASFEVLLAKPVLLGRAQVKASGGALVSFAAIKDGKAIELWARSQEGSYDLSGNAVVADRLRVSVAGDNLGQATIGEIALFGDDLDAKRHRVLPASIEGSDDTSFYFGAGNLFDGNIDTEWQAYEFADRDDYLPDIRSHARNAWPNYWRDWKDAKRAAIRVVLPAGKRVRNIQLYWGAEAAGSVEFKGRFGEKWKSLGTVNAAPATWSQIASPYPNDIIDEIQIVPTTPWRSTKLAAIGEVYFWGDGAWAGDEYRFPEVEGSDGKDGAFGVYSVDASLREEPVFEFAIRGQGATGPSVESDGQATAALAASLVDGDVSYYRTSLKTMLTGKGETVVWARGVTGQWLYGRIRLRAQDGRLEWGHPSDALCDGWSYRPSYSGGSVVIPFSKARPSSQARLFGDGRLEVLAGGVWTEPAFEAIDDGRLYRNIPPAESLRLTPGAAGASELELLGVPVSPSSPGLGILWPVDGQSLSQHEIMSYCVAGYTNSPDQVVKVNGFKAFTRGNLFWVPLSWLRLWNGKTAVITAELAMPGIPSVKSKIGVSCGIPDLWRLDIRDRPIETRDSKYRISGWVAGQDMIVLVGGTIVTPKYGYFSTDVAVEPGINEVPIRLVYAPTGTVMKSLTATIVRYGDGIILNVDGEGSIKYVSSTSYTVSGTIVSPHSVKVTANGKNLSIAKFKFSGTVTLNKGLNTISVVAKSRTETVTKTIQVFLTKGTPVLSLTSPTAGGWVSKYLTVSGTITDPAPAYIWVNGTKYDAASGSFNLRLPMQSEGEFTYKFQAQNKAGTYSAARTVAFKVDYTPPASFTTFANVNGWTNNNKPTLTFSTTDSYSGVARYEYSLSTGNSWTVAASPLQVGPLPDGIDEVDIRAVDNAGNATVSISLLYIDTTAPVAVQNLRGIPGKDSIQVAWTTTDTDVTRYHITRTPAWPEPERIVAGTELEDSDLAPGTVYSYSVRAEDRAANIGPAVTAENAITGLAVAGVSTSASEPTVLEYEDAKVIIPMEALPEGTLAVVMQEIDSPTLRDVSNYPIVSPIYSISTLAQAEDGTIKETAHSEFQKEVLFVLDYDPTQLPNGFPEMNLGVYYFDTTWSKWFKVEKSAVDIEHKKIVFTTNHFTDFSVQPTMITDLSPQQMKDIGHSPFKSESSAGAVTVSPQGGTAMTEVTDFVLPGRNGFSLPIKRIYDTGTATADSPSLSLSASLTFNSVSDLLSIAKISGQLVSQGVSGMVGAIQSKIVSMVKQNGDYALATGVGWRLNFPYVFSSNTAVSVRLPSGGYYSTTQMTSHNDFWTSNPMARSLDFEFHEGEDFTFKVHQVRSDVTDAVSVFTGQLSSSISSTIMSTIFESSGGSGEPGASSIISMAASMIPGWSTLYSELWMKDGTYYLFDGNGRVRKITDPSGLNTFTFEYDGYLLESITDDLGRKVLFEYNTGAIVAAFAKPVIKRIWTQGYAGTPAQASPTDRAVNFTYDWSSNGAIGTFFNFLPTLSHTTDPLNRKFEYSYDQLTVVTGGGGIKINFLALLLDFIPGVGSAIADALGIDALTLSGHLEINLPYVISRIVAPGIGTTDVFVAAKDLSKFDFQPTDYFLSLFPTALQITYDILFRLNTEQVTVTSSTGVKKTSYYAYSWSKSDGQYYVSRSSVNDGRTITVSTYSPYNVSRNRFISWDDYLLSQAKGLFQSAGLTIDEVFSLESGSTVTDAATGAEIQSTTQNWDTTRHRITSSTTTRGAAVSNARYIYDDWGNPTYTDSTSTSGGQTQRAETWSWYIGTSSTTPATWSVDAFDADDAFGTGIFARALPKGVVTRTYRPAIAGGGYEDTFQAFAYDSHAQKKAEGLWYKGHWAKSRYEYYYDSGLPYIGALRKSTGPTGQVTELAYDYSKGQNQDYYATTIAKAVADPDGKATDIISSTAYDWNTGWKVMDFDPRGWTTSYSYDALGRIVDTKMPGDEAAEASPSWNPFYINAPWDRIVYDDSAYTATLYLGSYTSGGSSINTRPYEKYFYDSLGQLIRIEKNNYRDVDLSTKVMRDLSPSETTATTATYSPWGEVIRIIDPNGNITIYAYDSQGRIRLTTYADKTSVSVAYDDIQSLRTTTNERGIKSEEWLDWKGQIQKKIEDSENLKIASSTYYDGQGRPVAVVDALGQATITWYNVWGKPARVQMPAVDVFMSPADAVSARPEYPTSLSRITPLEVLDFNDSGATISDKKGYEGAWRETAFTLDGLGRVIKESVSGRQAWRWYDAAGQVVTEGPVGIEADGREHRYLTVKTYTSRGQLATQTDPAGATTSFGYDRWDHKVRMTDPRGFLIRYDYNDLGRLVLAELPPVEGTALPKIAIRYDARGNTVERVESLGKTTIWQYDTRNRKVGETASATDGSTPIAKAFGYDEAGNPVLEIETSNVDIANPSSSVGVRLERTFDPLNRVLLEKSADGQEKYYRYDDLGRLVRSWDAYSHLTCLNYNSLNKVVQSIDPDQQVTDYAFNVWGDQTAMAAPGSGQSPSERQVWVRGYNAWGQLTYEINNLGQAWAASYDSVRGLAIGGIDPRGTTSTNEYSVTGLLVKRTLSNGTKTEAQSYAYDTAGALMSARDGSVTSLINAATGSYVANAYDLIKSLSTTVPGKTLQATYAYDLERRPVSVGYPDGSSISYSYNALGELLAIPGYASNGQYNFQGRLTSLTAANGTTRTKTWNATTGELDGYAWGNTGIQSRNLEWDNAGNLASQVRDGKKSSYFYDKLDRLTTAQEALPAELKASEVSAWGNADADSGGSKPLTRTSSSVKLDYHAQSVGVDLTQVVPIGGVSLAGTHARLTERTVELYLSQDNARWTKAEYHWAPSAQGVDLLLAEAIEARYVKVHCTWDERDAENAGLDHSTVLGKPYELIEVRYTVDGQTNTYSYDAQGNRLMNYTSTGPESANRTYEYYGVSNEIKYLKKGSSIEWSFAYDANGNMTTRARGATDNSGMPDFSTATETWLYEYDLQNRLVAVRKGNGGPSSATTIANYVYDHRGLRVKAVEGGREIYYQYDLSGDLLYRDDGIDKRDYIEALGQIWAEVRTTGTGASAASVTYYHHTDHLGTTEAMTDASGVVVWQGGFASFGARVSENGSIDGSGLFTGKEEDEYTGLYYFNARWYDPDLGRFINEDPARDGDNWYAYVGSNPLRYVDLFGLKPDVWSVTGNFFTGVWEGGKGAVVGTWEAVKHPIQTAKSIGNAVATTVTHPIKTAQAIYESAKEEVTEFIEADADQKARMLGNATGNVAVAALGTKGVTAAANGVKGAVGLGKAAKELAAAEKAATKADFYVRPDGTVIPSTGYRAIGGEASVAEAKSGVISSRNPTYLTFDDISKMGPTQAKEALQLPRTPTHSASFDTLQIVDDLKIPTGRWNTTGVPEPITKTFPEWGAGGATQAITNSPIKLNPRSLHEY